MKSIETFFLGLPPQIQVTDLGIFDKILLVSTKHINLFQKISHPLLLIRIKNLCTVMVK